MLILIRLLLIAAGTIAAVPSVRADPVPFPLTPVSPATPGWSIERDTVVAVVPCARDKSWTPDTTFRVYQFKYEANAVPRQVAGGAAVVDTLPPDDGYPVWLTIRIKDLEGAESGGKLWVDVAAVSKTKDGAGALVTKEFEFAREKVPAPKLEATPVVKIEFDRGLWRTTTSMSAFSVRVAHAASGSKTVAFDADVGTGTTPVFGWVSFDEVRLNGDGTGTVGKATTSDEPLGSSEYVVRARSAGLEPVTTKVTVVRRLGDWWLVVVLIVGIGFGSLVRTKLPALVAAQAFRTRLARLEQSIVREKEGRHEKTFIDAMDDLEKRLGTLRASTAALSARETDAQTLEASLATAVAAFEQRRAAALQRADGAIALLTAGWLMPKSIRERILHAKTVIEAAAASITANNLDAGTGALNDAIKGLLEEDSWDSFEVATEWWTTVCRQFDDALAKVPNDQKPSVDSAAQALRGAVASGAFDALAPDATPAEQLTRVRALLAALDTARRAARAAWSRLRDVALDYLSTVDANQAEQPKAGLKNFAVDAALAEDQPDFGPFLEHLRNAFGLQVLATHLGAAPGTSEALAIGSGPQVSSTRVQVVPNAPRHAWLDREIRSSDRASWQLNILHTALAGALLVLIGVAVFSPTWIGTLPDIVKVMFWGFTADVGTAALVTRASQLGGR